jgi:hypothetical protein
VFGAKRAAELRALLHAVAASDLNAAVRTEGESAASS